MNVADLQLITQLLCPQYMTLQGRRSQNLQLRRLLTILEKAGAAREGMLPNPLNVTSPTMERHVVMTCATSQISLLMKSCVRGQLVLIFAINVTSASRSREGELERRVAT